MNNIKYKSRLKGIISIIPIASVIFFLVTQKRNDHIKIVRKCHKNPLITGNSCVRVTVANADFTRQTTNSYQNGMLNFNVEETWKIKFISYNFY